MQQQLKERHEQHVSLSAFGSGAGCSLPEDHRAAARPLPAAEQNGHEGVRLLEKQRSWRAVKLARLESQSRGAVITHQ